MAEKDKNKGKKEQKPQKKKTPKFKKSTIKKLNLETNVGKITIELFDKLAPKHVERVLSLANKGLYDNVVFHRVIDGFMAQTGDVQFGCLKKNYVENRIGTGGSEEPDLQSEFSAEPFTKGVLGMARSQDPNSANSQFFIMLEDGPHLNNQYTVFGKVLKGMDIVDKIKKGDGFDNGKVHDPDFIVKMRGN